MPSLYKDQIYKDGIDKVKSSFFKHENSKFVVNIAEKRKRVRCDSMSCCYFPLAAPGEAGQFASLIVCCSCAAVGPWFGICVFPDGWLGTSVSAP
jgi:hypothetical protein